MSCELQPYSSITMTIATTTTHQQGPPHIKASESPAVTMPSVHESLFRFYPPTEYTTGRAIEDLNAQIAQLFAPCCSSRGNDNNSCSKRRKFIDSIYQNEDLGLPAVPQDRGNDDTTSAGVRSDRRAEEPDEEPPQLLLLVRHGQTDMNAAGRLQGRGVNAQLNEAGRRQADDLGQFVRNVPFGTIMSSSLDRAHETAVRIAAQNIHCVAREDANEPPAHSAASTCLSDGNIIPDDSCVNLRVLQNEGIDELSWGILEGQDAAQEPWKGELAALKAGWEDGYYDLAADKGENLLQVEARARDALEALLDEGHELNLVASHGRTLRILMLSLAGIGFCEMNRMGKIPNTGLYVVEARRLKGGAGRSFRLLRPSAF